MNHLSTFLIKGNLLIAIGYLAFLLNEQGTKCLKKDIATVLSWVESSKMVGLDALKTDYLKGNISTALRVVTWYTFSISTAFH